MINKNYFKYLLRSLWPLIIVAGVICLMSLGFFPAFAFKDTLYYNNLGKFTYTGSASGYSYIVVILSAAIPLIIHSRYYSKNSSDVYLSLPMNRKQAFITENIFGLMIVAGSVIAGFLIGLLMTFVADFQLNLMETYGQVLQFLPIVLLASIIMYLMSNLAASISNSMNEAFIILFAECGISLLIWGITSTYFEQFFPDGVASKASSFSFAPGVMTSMFSGYASWNVDTQEVVYGYTWYTEGIITLLINLVIWLGLNFFAYKRFLKLKSEHLGTASMEKFAGPDAVTTVFGLIFIEIGYLYGELFHYMDSTILLLLTITLSILICYWVIIFVLRRKIGFRKDDLIRFAISFVGGLVIGLVLYWIFL